MIFSVYLAIVRPQTFLIPNLFRVFAASIRVEPVVKTSSKISTEYIVLSTRSGFREKTPRKLCLLSSPLSSAWEIVGFLFISKSGTNFHSFAAETALPIKSD